ncbi:MAG TPA: carboxypeptidase-like regulatory domain-containing protein [Chitinophagaceae bacterium]|nr:carboxypeptidase-like regulatory domain-containing protein [Chitinophagaceae bacterium]
MLPLPYLRQGGFTILAGLLLLSLKSTAQLPEDLEKMGKEAGGYQFHLKFRGTTTTISDEKYAKISSLLEKYKVQVPADLQRPFKVQGAEAGQKPFLTDEQQSSLKNSSANFFREMANLNFTLWDLQQYKDQFKNKNPKPGDNPVEPKIAWKGEFEGIERTLMGGRTLMIMDVWKQTMIEYFNNHPEAVGVIYGQMDIGSWVKMNVDGLGFAADIDFSTIATDAKANQLLHEYFAENLRKASGLGMIPIDVVHTAHGLAGAEVFIGEWGKAFAEVDMLRRGKWKMLDVVKNENGQVTDIRTMEKEGKELFMQKAGETEVLHQKKDPVNAFDPKEKYPQLTMNMEPMLSLEMLRHAIHDIEHGPFSGGQKIIKMIKYTERSFFMMKEAGKDIPYNDAADYFNLTDGEKKLMTLCEEVIKNKSDAKKIAGLLEDYSGKKLESNEQVNLIVDDLTRNCKQAMLKNANQAFGYRVRKIALIEDENQRFEEADKFLKQLNEEFDKGYREGKTDIPRSMLRAHSILVDMRAGKVPPELVNSKLEELTRLMEEEYKVDKSFVERLIGDPWGPIRKYLVERGFGPEAVEKMVGKIKGMFTENWRYYAPEFAQKTSMTAYEYSNIVRNKLNSFNEHLAKTKPGKILSSEILNHLDNAVALYDAWISGKNVYESAKRVSWTAGTIWAQGKWPFLAIPLGIYNSIESKSVAPAAMAVAFYLFPMAGQAYMVTNLIDRLVVTNVREYNFRNHLDRLAVMARTDGEGHVILFKVPKAFNGLTGSADSLETEPNIATTEPARTMAIKEVFYNPEFMYCPDIKYFLELIPRKIDQFGLYDTKLKKLMTLFSFDNDFIGYLLGVEKFKKEKDDGTLPDDEAKYDREKMLDSLETGIEDHLWTAIFTAIESTKLAEKKGALEALEATILQLQDSLSMDDYHMKQIDSLGLLLKIRKQVQNDPMYIQALKNAYSAGTAYDRIAIPTMERYIQVYRQIIVIQKKIFDLWRPFGVDASKLQGEPFRLVLMGGRSGAPMLTTDPEADMQTAIKCLDAHTKRANDIRIDLASALGRPINENDKTDKEHLRILGEYGLGFEHLVDADANGRSPLFKDESGAVVKKMQEYSKAYRDYLDKIKTGPTLVYKLQLKAEQNTMETVPVTGVVTITDEKGKTVTPPPGITIEWYKSEGNQENKVAEGKSLTDKAEKKGYVTYKIVLVQKTNGKTTELDKTYWNLSVETYNLNDPTKGVKLKLPALIKQYDIVDVSAELPAAVKGKSMNCSWGYEALDGMKDCNRAKIQITSEQTSKGEDGKINLLDSISIGLSVEMPEPGKLYGTTKYITQRVKYQHLSLSIKTTDIWEGGAGSNWAGLKRKQINSPQRVPPWSDSRKAVSTASAYATINIKYDKPWGDDIKSTEELQAYITKEYNTANNKAVTLKAFNLGDFKGYGVYTPPRYDPGGWSDAGYRAAGAFAGFEGFVMKGKAFFKINWWAGASGAFDNSDQGWMMSMIKMLDAECQSVVGGICLQPDGRHTKSAYNGPKLDGSDYPQVSIEPKLDTIQPGSKVLVKAVIKNDKPDYGPYTYNWTGNVEGNSTGASVQLESARPGKKTISVSVDGTTPPGSASVEYVVAPLKVKLIKVSPSTNKIIVGMPIELRADFVSAVPAGRKLQYRWQPHPEEKYEPFEGTRNTTKLVFTKPGLKKIWVQVLDKTTAETITMGESEQLELEVEKPAFRITFSPAKALVGEQVTAKISSVPDKLEEVNYRWMPLPSNARQLKESQDGTEVIFYAKDALQIPLEVLAVVKGSGEELGNIKAYFNAERFSIKAEGPKVQGPKPMIWKPGVGLVEVDKEIAVHQVVEFNTVISPQPAGTLTYQWLVTEGNASISNPASKDARVTALETGTIKLKVKVKDNNGVELGDAITSFSATISSEMITNGASQKKAFDDKMQQARQFIKDGKLDEAFKLGEELKGMNAKEAVPLLTELAEACKKAGKDAAYERDFILAIKRYQQALQLNPNDAAARNQLEQNRKWQKDWAGIEAKGNELDENVTRKNLPGTQKCINDLNKLQLNMPGQMANKWSQEKSRKFNDLLKSCDSAYHLTRTNWTNDFKAKDFENALPRLEAFKAEWTAMPETMKEIESSIQLCKMQIAEKKKIYEDFLVTRSKFENGLPIDPKQNATTIEYTASTRFSSNDARQKEMIGFARGMDKRQKDMIANRDRAAQLKKEGQQAETAGQKETALGKYKESVALIPDAVLENRIRVLETEVAAIKTRKAKADQLWNDGLKLADKKKTKKEGLGKMKESLEWWSDADRVKKIRDLEKEVNGSFSNLDIRGTWRHGNSETMTFTPLGEGQYAVIEKGFDNATGTLSMMGENGVIQYTTKSGISGQYLLSFSADGNKATGKWNDNRNESGIRSFTRISKPETPVTVKTPEPAPVKTPEPVTTQTPPTKKKKKSFTDVLNGINKGLGKLDSTISGKKPVPPKTEPSGPVIPPVNNDVGVNPADVATEEKIFDNGNIGGVSGGPSQPTRFTLSKTTYITRIENYHYFNGGKKPGTIALLHSNGQQYGPWQSYGLIGQGGVQNAYWVAQPKMQLPAGTYTVIDSDPSTWSQNGQSGGAGFTTVWALKSAKQVNQPAKEVTPPPTTQPPVQTNDGTVSQGVIYGTVFKTREESGKTNPYDLEGVPLPNTTVTIKYVQNGQTITKKATTDGSGKFRFTGLPLNVTISINSRNTTVNRLLTSSGPQYVQFGWDGEIEIK